MKHRWMILLGIMAATGVHAVTPLDAPVPEGRATEIECEYKGTEGFRTFGKAQTGVFHYRVVLPTGYAANKERRYPCIFVMGPGGGGSPGKAEKWFKENNWIIIQLIEARNGPWEPILGCFLAAHDDAVKRFRIAEGLKYATGFSGGARGSSCFVNMRPGFAGLWCQGATFAQPQGGQLLSMPQDQKIAVHVSMGTEDFNLGELNQVRKLPPPFRYEIHDGAHVMSDYDTMVRALEWLELQPYLHNPGNKITAALAADYFQKRFTAMSAASTPFAKYQIGVTLKQVAARWNLSANPALAAAVRQVAVDLVPLESSPVIRNEKLAQTAYEEAQVSELKARTNGEVWGRKAVPDAQRKITGAYRMIAEKFADTTYGQLAAARVEALSGSKEKKE